VIIVGQFHHLCLEEREKLFLWKQIGISFREIGRRLGRSHTSITHEWKRNKSGIGKRSREYTIFRYLPCRAQYKSNKRATRQRTKAPLKGPLIFLYVREHLRKPYSWSPETIAGKLCLDYPGKTITIETIYAYIYGKKQKRMKLWKYLRLHRKKRMRKDGRKVKSYAKLASAIPIEQRPDAANHRTELGHVETDNVEGKRSDKTSISVTVDRLSRITRLRKLKNHKAKTKTAVLIPQLRHDHVKTVTLDRGPENSDYRSITRRTGIQIYACNAYHSWEKPTVENTNGRLRWFIPKGNSVDHITQQTLNKIEDMMNNTPRKILGFLTPNEFVRKIQSTSKH
jgi:IS30 family transposase